MAVWEKYDKWSITDVSWRDGFSQDPYYWLSNSYQYSENINTDDELHWIKLAQKALSANVCPKCNLVQAGGQVFALPLDWWTVKVFNSSNWTSPTSTNADIHSSASWSASLNVSTYGNGTVFQDYFWFGMAIEASKGSQTANASGFWRIQIGDETTSGERYIPYDHTDATDESISDPSTKTDMMSDAITAVLNYNNTRLVVWAGQSLRVYYPELDMNRQDPDIPRWQTGWKKVQTFENGCTIIALTCTFQYLKIRVTDEWWNTKVYYYQGNDDLRNTFVYDLVDLTNTKVLRVYPINWIDYYTASLDWTDGFVTFNKLVGKTPIQLLKQRPWLSSYDANQKAAYFVWPTSMSASYLDGVFYVADSYGVWKFKYNPQWADVWYLKWKLHGSSRQIYGLAVCENYVYVSDSSWLYRMRLYDTWLDGYQSKWLLVSREFEWTHGGCIAKMLDDVRVHFELNPLINDSDNAGSIDIYVSPNNLRHNVDPEDDDSWRYKVMHIDWASGSQNRLTRFEITKALNNLNGWTPAFEFDRETITYCVVIKRWSSSAQRTPIIREVSLTYHTKGKTNNIYDIK